MSEPVAALYVQPAGIYSRLPGVEPWGLPDRDARDYAGPHRVVAHPPCGPWGNYAKPTPESTARGPLLGDDGGCFAAAVRDVRRYGGVLEHPVNSRAWPCGGVLGDTSRALPKPATGGGWTRALFDGGWSCEVDQGHYGHAARKPTWLYYVGAMPPPELVWGPSHPAPIGSGARRGNLESMSKTARAATPPAFAALLVELARWGIAP